MKSATLLTRFAPVLAVAAAFAFSPQAHSQDSEPKAAEALQAGVQLFNEGDFVGSRHALTQIDPQQLSDLDRTTHTEYLQRADLAVSMFQKAEADYEAAMLALTDGRIADAASLLRDIRDNAFAAKETVQAASDELRKIQAAGEVAPSGTDEGTPTLKPLDESDSDITRQRRSLRAKVLVREATQAMDAGRLQESQRLFSQVLDQVPGHPDATAGLERLAQHEMVESDARSLINRYKERNLIAWQRTVATYRQAEREVRDHVLNNRYDQAGQILLRAHQIVEAGKTFADPVARYEALRHDSDALGRYVADEQRRFDEQEIGRQRAEAREKQSERVRQTRKNKRERINTLMSQALQHRRDRNYESAINVLRQVTAIDAMNDEAKWLIMSLEDQQNFEIQRQLHDDQARQTQNVLIDVKRSHVPWWEDITYPKNWREIISRPTRRGAGIGSYNEIDSDLQSRLDKTLRLDFDGDPLKDVLQRLADANDVNISVVWSDLAAAAIAPSAPVILKLSNPVPLSTALREVLDNVGGNAELGYLANGGLIKVATRSFLDRHVTEEVYDVRDLLMPIPDFNDAPTMDLANLNVFVAARSAGAFAGGNHTLYPDEEDEYAEEHSERDADKLISLIRDTIRPDSWRANGGDVGSITEINGQLVITQTPTGHARIGGLLSKLREQRAIQVAVEARFITVQSNYLEELGLDLDIILNAGNAGFDLLPGGGGTLSVDPVLGSRLLLPRSFSRMGFGPSVPAVGTTLGAQPFTDPSLVPARGGNIGGNTATPIPVLNNVLQLTNPGTLTSDLPGSFAGNPTVQPALAVFGSFLDNIQVDFLIRATQADSRTSLLTAPRLVMFNGQRAWVAVVNQQSFVSSLQPVIDAEGAQPLISTIETGAVLDAQTTVSSDKRYVTLTLRPSVGRLLGIQTFAFTTGAAAGQGAFVQLPNISRQVLRTTVTVPDGGTLLIGGQKLAGEIEVESGVPILSKIPILKRLYSSRTLVKDEQVLLILIKPKIIIQSEAEQEAFPTFQQG